MPGMQREMGCSTDHGYAERNGMQHREQQGVRQDLMCCRDVYEVALFVHKCMKIADAAATAAARQQPR
jgi:hypothetical protein